MASPLSLYVGYHFGGSHIFLSIVVEKLVENFGVLTRDENKPRSLVVRQAGRLGSRGQKFESQA